MKNFLLALIGLASCNLGWNGQGATLIGLDAPTVVERGPHHRIVELMARYRTSSGRIVERTGSYVELGTGMHYFDRRENRWKESQPAIEIFKGYSVARQGQLNVTFLANLNSSGAIEMAFDDQRFASHMVALLYTDALSGQSVVIAQIKDSVGQVLPQGRVLYPDAFTDRHIDVLYSYTWAGLEQDLVFREALPDPRLYGIDPQFARVEAITEFLEAPEPVKSSAVGRRNAPAKARGAMAEPEVTDETLRFGALIIGAGGVFREEDRAAGVFNKFAIPISKRWIKLNQRRFLFEIVDYTAVEPELRRLPKSAAMSRGQPKVPAGRLANRDLLVKGLTAPPSRKVRDSVVRMASLSSGPKGTGLVWDYSIAIGQTDFTFRGDTTYFVRSDVRFGGRTRIEGGAVVKFTNSTAAASRLLFQGPVECLTSPWNPAFFTSMSDHTVGEVVSTNALSGHYGTRLLDFSAPGQDFVLHNLKLRYGAKGLVVSAGNSLTATNLQLGGTAIGLEARGDCTVNLFNALIYDVGTALAVGTGTTVRGEHVTFHHAARFRGNPTSAWPSLTNCLLIGAGRNVAFNGSNVEIHSSDSGVFRSVGAGSRYLSENSPYINAGTTHINPALALLLREMTTHPPVVLTNAISHDTVLSPHVPRDSDWPDLGYHYPVADFAIGDVSVSNATVLLTNGVVVATFGPGGFRLEDRASLISQGTPLAPNILARYNAIQEQAVLWGETSPLVTFYPHHLGGAPPTARLRFTHAAVPSGGGQHTASAYPGIDHKNQFAQLEIKDSQLSGGSMALADTLGAVYGFTNNLLERIHWAVEGDARLSFRNNLIRGGSGYFLQTPTSHSPWTFKDNLLDSCELRNGAERMERACNAYFHSTSFYSAHDTRDTELVLTHLSYEIGPLGRYYQPTNSALIDAGSRDAVEAGLAHFTAIASEVKEGHSRVDIGLHYVATDHGIPIDRDGDGLPDALEDANGNGKVDPGETDGVNSDTDYDEIGDGLERLQGRNPLTSQPLAGSFRFVLYTPLR